MYEILKLHYSKQMKIDHLMMNLFSHDHLMMAKKKRQRINSKKKQKRNLQNLFQDDQKVVHYHYFHLLNFDEYLLIDDH